MAQLHSPFKFLAPYSAKDKENFWGRDTETLELYKMLTATNLVLLYGPSGTGKTSLVQCGLTRHFNGPDWIPLVIRRGENVTKSVREGLSQLSELPKEKTFREHINSIYSTYNRPVYLFFDQFEEVFTLAAKDEQQKVILDEEGKLAEVKELFAIIKESLSTVRCKFVLILREEFLGQLYTYENDLPTLFDFRLRIEPMNTAKIGKVLTGTFKSFNISCNPPGVIKAIASNLLEGNATSQLAYLQVYLDRLWKTTYTERYGEEEWVRIPPPVELNEGTLRQVETVKKVLEVYLGEQAKAIASTLEIEETWIQELLDSFVTDDGTKRPIAEGSSRLNSKNRFTGPKLDQCLAHLENARLIRKDNQYYELAHDALAAIVASKRTTTQRLVKDITQIIRTSYQFWFDKKGGYLTTENVALYDQYKTDINDELEGNEHRGAILSYIEDSRRENERERQELEDKNIRLEAGKKELEENERKLSDSNQALEKTNSNQKLALGAIGVLLLVLVGFITWGYNLYNTNETNLKNSETNLKESKQNLSKYYQEQANQLKQDAKVYVQTGGYEGYKDALEKLTIADSLVSDDLETEKKIAEYRNIINGYRR